MHAAPADAATETAMNYSLTSTTMGTHTSTRMGTLVASLVAIAGLALGAATGASLASRHGLPDPVGPAVTIEQEGAALAPAALDGPDEGAACMLSGAPARATDGVVVAVRRGSGCRI